MRPRTAVHPIVQTGLLLIGAGTVLANLAWLHMRSLSLAYGAICGVNGLAHCPACPASALLLAAGLAALALPRAQAQTARGARADN
jgi:hypothetical protein